MADNKNNIVNLFEVDETVATLLASAQDENCDSLFIIGLKDGVIFYGHSSYPSALQALGALEIVKANIIADTYSD